MGHYASEMGSRTEPKVSPEEAKALRLESDLRARGVAALEKMHGKDAMAVAFAIHSMGDFRGNRYAEDYMKEFSDNYNEARKEAIKRGLIPKR